MQASATHARLARWPGKRLVATAAQPGHLSSLPARSPECARVLPCYLPAAAGKKIAIEADGPFHYTVNGMGPGGEPTELGTTIIRRRMLRAGGWSVLSIPFYEW